MFQRVDTVLLVVGSSLFLVGAFSPISMAVFTESDAAKRLETIQEGRNAWSISQVFFALGAIVTGIGVGLAAYHYRGTPGSWLAYLGFAAIAVGAALWSWHVYLRTVDPKAFTEGSLPAWLFGVYTVLTQAGLAAFGMALLHTGTPSWVGWMLIGGSTLLFIAYLIFRDMPPFVYYILTLITGVMLYRAG